MKSETLRSVRDRDFELKPEDRFFKYQESLTKKLDSISDDFNQETINEIVLWKVNRYAGLSQSLLQEINTIQESDSVLNEDLTRRILKGLLESTKGVQLPMASTILRFRNPRIYQILDQRVYRIIYGEKLKLGSNLKGKRTEDLINLYLKYLVDLRGIAKELNIEFELSDRILFMADKRVNKEFRLENYSSKINDLED